MNPFRPEYWMARRQALLAMVEALEQELIAQGIMKGPTTAQIRKQWKAQQREMVEK